MAAKYSQFVLIQEIYPFNSIENNCPSDMINNFQSNKEVICMFWDVLIVLCINFQRISAAILLSVICYEAVTYETLRIYDLGWL